MVVWECAINKDSIKAVDQVMFFLNNANKLAGSNQTTLRLLAK